MTFVLFACDFSVIFVIFVRDFFISRKMNEKISNLSLSRVVKTLNACKDRSLLA